MAQKVPVDHGFYVRLATNGINRPAGRYWFAAVKPKKRPPNLVRFLRHHPTRYYHVASITAATQTRRNV